MRPDLSHSLLSEFFRDQYSIKFPTLLHFPKLKQTTDVKRGGVNQRPGDIAL